MQPALLRFASSTVWSMRLRGGRENDAFRGRTDTSGPIPAPISIAGPGLGGAAGVRSAACKPLAGLVATEVGGPTPVSVSGVRGAPPGFTGAGVGSGIRVVSPGNGVAGFGAGDGK